MNKGEKIRLLLVDDHPIVRDGLKARLLSRAHIEIVGEASDGQEALEKARAFMPDVVFMDIGMPGMNGLETTRRLCQILPDVKVIILTIYDDEEYALQALRSGAKGYLLKNAPSPDLVHALEIVCRGEMLFSENVVDLAQAEGSPESRLCASVRLSDRECEVLAYIAEGWMNREIAEKLGVGIRTVETHRENVMRKLDLHSVADLTRYAISIGLVRLE